MGSAVAEGRAADAGASAPQGSASAQQTHSFPVSCKQALSSQAWVSQQLVPRTHAPSKTLLNLGLEIAS